MKNICNQDLNQMAQTLILILPQVQTLKAAMEGAKAVLKMKMIASGRYKQHTQTNYNCICHSLSGQLLQVNSSLQYCLGFLDCA